ncbi:Alpha/Beta hydrolase protein [Xylaria sp. CBS 124048]|nr:Alpha/Beta hydrolase protein [Xylaria sp. CBS 124048]
MIAFPATKMTPNPAPSLSTAEKIWLTLWLLFVAPIKLAVAMSQTLWMASSRGLRLRRFLPCPFYRVALGQLLPNHFQALLPGTVETYQQFMEKAKTSPPKGDNFPLIPGRLQEKIEPLGPASCIMWLGNPATADKIVYFFHGGGYKVPMSDGHLHFCVQAFLLANPKVEVAVALLEYTLAPAHYPVQLSQAAAGLAHLLNSGIKPENIIVGGDSAGGNLTAQLLGHLLHPHPDVTPIQLSRPLLGAFMASPWLTTHTDGVSYRENTGIDMLTKHHAILSQGDVLTGSKFEEEKRQGKGWAFPLDVDESWFDGLSCVVTNFYISVGQHEVLRSEGVAFADIIRRRNPDVKLEVYLAAQEAHDFILVEGLLRVVDTATRKIRAWASSVISKTR